MTAQIFVRQLTAIDSALTTVGHGVQGVSWNVDVEWLGPRDPRGMVVDFGRAKKLAKACIDTHFDHKLLLPSSWLNHTCATKLPGYAVGCFWVATRSGRIPGALCAPLSHFCPLESNSTDEMKALEHLISTSDSRPLAGTTWLEKEIGRRILADSPSHVEAVNVTIRPEILERNTQHYSYTHSLRTHDGNCQRFHGHHNRIEVTGSDREGSLCLEEMIAEYMHGRYLVASDYASGPTKSSEFGILKAAILHWLGCVVSTENHLAEIDLDNVWTHIQYTGSQGPVWLMLPEHIVEWLPSESTVENIAQHIKTKFCVGKFANCRIRAFEGISKGSLSP
jgi:6-pyruvoyl-tetrahydropterin synthase